MDPAINLSFQYEERDYVRALRSHFASRMRVWRDSIFAAAVMGFGAYLWIVPRLRWLGITLLVVGAGFALLLLAMFTVVPPLAFRREAKFRDAYKLTFTSEGIHFRTAHIDSHLEWKMYTRVLIDDFSYVLYYGTHQFTVIPRRVFQGLEQQQAFEVLVARHVSEINRRKV